MKLKFEKEEFCKVYDELQSSQRVAEYFNTTKATVLRYAKLFGYDNSKYKTFKNEVGNKYGMLTVIERVDNDAYNKAQYRCRCDCGNSTIVSGAALRNGNTKSCGCYRNIYGETNKIDERGHVYGKLTVLEEFMERTQYRQIKWICRCQCGNTVIVQGNHLRSGHTQSCGCTNSRGEAKISSVLSAKGVQFQGQYTFSDLISDKGGHLFFDFAVFNNSQLIGLIEYDGIQHYQEAKGSWSSADSLAERQHRDQIKDEYCANHNILLLRIKYTDFDNIEQILTEYLDKIK